MSIIRFLMEIENPSADVQKAIHAAVAFYAHVEIRGFTHNGSGPSEFGTGANRVLTPNASARNLWARFIDINTFQPLFSDRRNPDFRPGEQAVHATRPGVLFASPGGNLRNIYVNAGGNDIPGTLTNSGTVVVHPSGATFDLVRSYANLSHERRNGYGYVGSWGNALPGLYNTWLTRNGLTAP
jgi:hypothetical protein